MVAQREGAHAEPPPNPMVSIQSIVPSLPPAERRVAEGILARPADVVTLSIGDLAERAGTSEATVTRFCKRAGFRGYPDMRLALATHVGRSQQLPRVIIGTEVSPDDDLADVVRKVGAVDAQAINDTVEQLDTGSLARVADAIAVAPRIELYGIGASGLAAVDLEQKLRRIGRPAAVATDGHAALTSAAVLGPTDVAIGISHSGETLDVVDPIEQARDAGATTVAITNYPRSSLAEAADLLLTTAAQESLFRAGAMASRTAQLTVIDCIYLSVARRDYQATIRALELTSAAVSSRRRARSWRTG